MLNGLRSDLRQGWRALYQQPLVSGVVVLSLGLGIALNVMVFSLVSELLFSSPGVERPKELARAFTSHERGDVHGSSSYPDYLDLRERTESFRSLAAHSGMITSYAADGESMVILGELVSENYFEVLGVDAARGRLISSSDVTAPGADRVVVLGHGFWQQRLSADEGVVGDTIRLNGTRYTVIGVAPESFSGTFPGLEAELFVPVTMADEVEPAGSINVMPSTGDSRLERRGFRWLWMVGRLEPGATVEGAAAELSAVMSTLTAEYPDSNRDLSVRVVPANRVRINPDVDGALTATASVLLVVVGVVLLVVCGNVANMLLARASQRRRELAVRMALGAGRGRLVRQLLIESLVLSGAAGVVGLGLALGGNRLLAGFSPEALPVALSLDLPIDGRVLAFSLVLTLLVGVIFGLAPAFVGAGGDVNAKMRREDPRPRRLGLGQVLVVAQVALCLSLLVGAGLLMRSLVGSGAIGLGLDAPRLGAVTTDLGMIDYDEESAARLQQELVRVVEALPDVEAATWAQRIPFDLNLMATQLRIEGFDESSEGGVNVDYSAVGPEYFDVFEIPIVAGRGIEETDVRGSEAVAVVNRAFAERFWPGEQPIGKRLWSQSGSELRVVGVSADYKVRTVAEESRALVHFAHRQMSNNYGNLVFRGRGRAHDLIGAVRSAMLEVEPDLVVMDATGLDRRVELTLFPLRAGSYLLGGVALFGVLLAGVGLYGLIAYWVVARRREIGLRMALGARPGEVTAMVVRRGLVLTASGLVLGVFVALAVARLVRGVLVGVSATDPATFTVAAALLLAVTLIAAAFPARRAARVDPLVVLRED